MKDIKEFVELNDEELNQVSGGKPGEWTPTPTVTVSKKGWVCKNCGYIDGTWTERGGVVATPDNPGTCSNCGSRNSFEIRDL